MEQEQRWPSKTRWVITADEVGSVQLDLYDNPQGEYGVRAYIYALWVEKPYRRQGRASYLLRRAEEIAKCQGHKVVYLEWSRAEAPCEICHWYERRGYEAVSFSKSYALMKKDLASRGKVLN